MCAVILALIGQRAERGRPAQRMPVQKYKNRHKKTLNDFAEKRLHIWQSATRDQTRLAGGARDPSGGPSAGKGARSDCGAPAAKAGDPSAHPGLPCRHWARPLGIEPGRKGTSGYPRVHWIVADRPVLSGSSRSCWACHRGHTA